MERSNFFTDQDVLQEDLNNIETTKGNQLKLRAQYILGFSGGVNQSNSFTSASIVRGGIYFNPGGAPGGVPPDVKDYFFPLALSSTSIRILTGAALDPNGEVMVNPATIDMTKGSTGTNYDWSTSSPGSSVLWYVKLRYVEVSGSVKADDLGISYPTRYTDDFIINVDYTVPTTEEILLSSFVGSVAGDISGSIVDERSFVRVLTPANAVLIDPSIVPVASHATAEDHITAVGTGTPTATNPHGLAPGDIGVGNEIEPHIKASHTPGIIDITGEYPDSAAFKNSYLGTPTDLGADVDITWTSANANAAIIANGVTYTPTLVTVSLVNHPDMVAGGDNTYWVYFDNSTTGIYNTRATTSNLDNYKVEDKLVLCKIQRISGGSDYANFVDLRKFYGTSQEHVSVDLDENATFDTLNLVSTLKNNLNRIRYQLGLALSGAGSAWGGSNPVTSGGSSIADAYHTHSSFPFAAVTVNGLFAATSATGYYINHDAGEKAGMIMHVTSPADKNRLFFISNYTGIGVPSTVMKATGSFAALEVDGKGSFGSAVVSGAGTFGSVAVAGIGSFGSLSATGDGSIGGNLLVSGSASVVDNVVIGGNPITPTQAGAIPTLTDGPSSNADAYHTHAAGLVGSPATGSMVVGYTNNTQRQNTGTDAMYVYGVVLSSVGVNTVTLYVTEISGSYGSDTIVNKHTIHANAYYATVTGVVPPNFYYKINAAGSITSIDVQEFPPNGA